MSPAKLFAVALFVMFGSASARGGAGVDRLELDNGAVHLELTPSFGGRVLAFGRHGARSLLKIGLAVQTQPQPAVTPQAGDIAYLGHDVWVGPQREWWLHQDVAPARRAAAANWPPDPYLSLAQTRVVEQTRRLIHLAGVDSPVSGVRLTKRFALADDRDDSVELSAVATNIRDTPVAWDLWFNTRVASAMRVFVPVADLHDVRTQPVDEPGISPPAPRWKSGMLIVDAPVQAAGATRRGKLLLQPAAGWIAGFADGQMLVIRFERLPRSSIHPDQGQVELYLDAPAERPGDGLLELEVHGAYRQLAPGERMQLHERWSALRYDGADDPLAQRAFLCTHAEALALRGACPAD